MIINQFRVERFGLLSDLTLDLQPGLQVIHGRNEQGKTTLLAALRTLLYGFGTRVEFAYGYDGKELALGAKLTFRDGAAAEVRRKRGTKQQVTGSWTAGSSGEVDDGILERTIGGDKALFEQVFGITLAELERGADALRLDGKTGATIYSSGLGGGLDITTIIAELKNEAEALFTDRGQKQIAILTGKELDDLASQFGAVQLKPEDYDQAVKARDALAEQVKALSRELAELRAREQVLSRVRQARPLQANARALAAELAELVIPAAFLPADAEQVEPLLASHREREESAEEALQRLAEATTRLEEATAQTRPALLAAKATIASLNTKIDQFAKQRRDLPALQQVLLSKEATIRQRLAELRPGWTVDALDAWQPDVATITVFDQQADRGTGLQTEAKTQEAERSAEQRRRDQCQADLDGLAEPADTQAVEALLANWPAHQEQVNQLAASEAKLLEARRHREAARRTLTPPLPAEADLAAEALPVPSSEAIGARVTKFDDLRQRQSRLVERQQKLAEEITQAERALAADQAARELPDPATWLDLRSRRDLLWQAIRQHWIAGQAVDFTTLEAAREDAPDLYESRVAAADTYAQRLQDQANEVAEREQAKRRLSNLNEDLARLEIELADWQADEARWQADWRAFWQDCHLSPDEPAVMSSWRQKWERYVAFHQAEQAATGDRDNLAAVVQQYEAALAAALSEPDQTGEALRQHATALVKQAKEQREQRERLVAQLADLDRRLAERRERLAANAAALAQWQTDWSAVLGQLGLETDLIPAAAKAVVHGLKEVKAQRQDAVQTASRIRDMQTELAGYTQQTSALLEQLGETLGERLAEVAVSDLQSRLEEARQAAAQEEERRTARQAAETALADARRRLAAVADQLAELRQRAEAADDQALRLVAENARQAAQLRSKLDGVNEQLQTLRLSGATEEFDQAIADQTTNLDQAIAQKQADIEVKSEELNRTNQDLGAAEATLRSFAGEAQAAELQQQIETMRSKLVEEAEEYAVLRLAVEVLNQEVIDFQRQNQPEMLQSAGTFFQALTAGRYEAVQTVLGDNDALVVVTEGGKEMTPETLSTGTREQLYLALRMAYIKHHNTNPENEPLPMILDDVLVNFDDERAKACLAALQQVTDDQQVLLFTCHQHLVDKAEAIGVPVLNLPALAS